MYCIHCGAPNPDNGVTCLSCGARLVNPQHGQFSSPQGGPRSDNPYQASAGSPTGASPFAGQPLGPKPQNYLAWAIIVTLCCGCWPFGVVAIVYAAQVDSKFNAGDYAGAQAASDSAKLWCMIAGGIGLLIFVAYLGLVVLGGVAGNLR